MSNDTFDVSKPRMRHDELAEAGDYASAARLLRSVIKYLPPDAHEKRCEYQATLATWLEFSGDVREAREAQELRRQVIADEHCPLVARVIAQHDLARVERSEQQ